MNLTARERFPSHVVAWRSQIWLTPRAELILISFPTSTTLFTIIPSTYNSTKWLVKVLIIIITVIWSIITRVILDLWIWVIAYANLFLSLFMNYYGVSVYFRHNSGEESFRVAVHCLVLTYLGSPPRNYNQRQVITEHVRTYSADVPIINTRLYSISIINVVITR